MTLLLQSQMSQQQSSTWRSSGRQGLGIARSLVPEELTLCALHSLTRPRLPFLGGCSQGSCLSPPLGGFGGEDLTPRGTHHTQSSSLQSWEGVLRGARGEILAVLQLLSASGAELMWQPSCWEAPRRNSVAAGTQQWVCVTLTLQ